jgi:hypothetical protein
MDIMETAVHPVKNVASQDLTPKLPEIGRHLGFQPRAVYNVIG